MIHFYGFITDLCNHELITDIMLYVNYILFIQSQNE